MKIAQIIDQSIPYVSGYSIRSKYIANSLRKLGVDLEVFTSPIFDYASQKEEHCKIWYFRTRVAGWSSVKKIKFFKEYVIINSIKNTILNNWQEDYKLIHAYSSVLNGLAGLAVARKKKVPVIYEVRALWEDAAVEQGKTRENSLRYNATRKIETDLLRKVDKITVICEGLKRDIITRGIPENKITVVPNGVDLEDFKPIAKDEEIIKKYSLNGFKIIGFIGTFFSFEGIEVLIKSIPSIAQKIPNVKFMIVGGGEVEKYLKELVEKEKLSQWVIFTGRVKHEDVKRYYSIMDILVYPRISKRITEMVTPVKPLEAMALGKTVIGSDVGGIKELIKDGETGLIFKAGDYKDLADKCIFTLNNPSLMKDINIRARNYVEKERNWLEICKRYLDVYKELGVNVKC